MKQSWRGSPRLVTTLALAAALVVLLPVLAGATSKVSRQGNVIQITSGGKSSNINIGTGIGSSSIQDYQGKLSVGAGCRRLDRHRAYCGPLGGRKIRATLGGGTDTIGTILGSVKFVVSGGAGGDNLYGASRNDTIFGGPGADEIYGGSGEDYLVGGGGRDDIDCDTGIDVVNAGPGDRLEECEIRR